MQEDRLLDKQEILDALDKADYNERYALSKTVARAQDAKSVKAERESIASAIRYVAAFADYNDVIDALYDMADTLDAGQRPDVIE